MRAFDLRVPALSRQRQQVFDTPIARKKLKHTHVTTHTYHRLHHDHKWVYPFTRSVFKTWFESFLFCFKKSVFLELVRLFKFDGYNLNFRFQPFPERNLQNQSFSAIYGFIYARPTPHLGGSIIVVEILDQSSCSE